MAEIEGEILGKIKGKLGSIVFRKLNGKTVLSARPVKYKAAKTKPAKKTRAKFALTVSFARFVNSIITLKEIWTKAAIPGTNSYQKLIKHNLKITDEDSLTVKNMITPPGIPLMIEKLILNNDGISFTINLDNSRQNNELTFPFQVYSILYFSEPKTMIDLQNFFEAAGAAASSDENKYIFKVQIKLNNKQLSLFNKYNECIIYIAIISGLSNSNEVNWSSTFSTVLNRS